MRRNTAMVAISVVLLAFVVGALSSSRAAADGGWGTITDGVPEAVVVVTTEGVLARWDPGRPGGPRWTCGYHAIDAPVHSVLDPTPVVDWTTTVVPRVGEAYMFGCFVEEGGERRLVRSRYVIYDPGDPFAGVIAVVVAVDEARARLDLPDPDPVVNPPTEQLVGLPMWMWLDRPWERVTAVASIRDVWAAVAAQPILAHWSFSDGTDLWCDRGVAYDIWRPAREQSSGCTHVWRRSSSSSVDGLEWVRVTMVWRVEWYATDVGGQPMGTVERTTTFPVRVVEAQAVIR